jgi:tetratricopeptide (TPR) repeat protein
MRCLERRKQELRVLVDALEHVGRESLFAAVSGAQALADPRACDTADVPQAPPPRDPEARRRFDAILPLLSGARGALALAHYRAGLGLARAACAEAQSIGHKALLAEALALRGELENEADEPSADATLHEALRLATELGHESVVADVATTFAIISGREERFLDAEHWIDLAMAANSRSGGTRTREGRLINLRGFVEMHTGKREEAREHFAQAASMLEDESHTPTSEGMRARANVGLVYWDEGRYDEALAVYRQVVADRERLLGPEDPVIPVMSFNVALLLLRLEQPAEVRPILERAIATRLALAGEKDVSLNVWRIVLAEAERELGDMATAASRCAQAYTALQQRYGDDHSEVAAAVECTADVLRAEGRHAEAAPLYARVLATLKKKVGAQSTEYLDALHAAGMDRLEAGDDAAAVLLEEEATTRGARESDAIDLADARFGLARALAARDPAQARSLAEEAKKDAIRAGARGLKRSAPIDQFLAELAAR